MSLTTITINGVDYSSYATVAEADAYLAIDLARSNAWAALDEAAKGQHLATATRQLDGMQWAGRKASETQTTAWPRMGMTPTPSASIPLELEHATMQLAGDLAADPGGDGQGRQVQSERVGPMAVTYFYSRMAARIEALSALALVRQWLKGPSVAAPVATGTDARSEFASRDRYGRTEGIG